MRHRSFSSLLLLLAVPVAGCFASTAREGGEGESRAWFSDDGAGSSAAPLVPVDHCVATNFAWIDDRNPAEADPLLVFANYPLFSPQYRLELYGADLWVRVDDELAARRATTEWGADGIENVVFGRREGEETWQVLADPEAVCPSPPEDADEFPTD